MFRSLSLSDYDHIVIFLSNAPDQAKPPAFVAFNFLIQSEKEKFRNLLGVISTPT